MASARCLAMLKLLLDLLYIGSVFCVYFIDVFEFLNRYNIGIYQVVQRDAYLTSSLYKEIEVKYRDFYPHFCSSQSADTEIICDHRENFEDAGILYFTFTALSNIIAIYSVFGMLGIFCKCSSIGVILLEVLHYIYPGLHALAFILFLLVSRIFVMTTPAPYNSSKYQVKVKQGLILMIVAQILGTSSAILFIFSKKSFKSSLKVAPNKKKVLKMRVEPK